MGYDPHLPPGPYHYVTTSRDGEHHGIGHVYLCDANGRKIASMWGTADEKLALVELIVGAEQLPADILDVPKLLQEVGSDGQASTEAAQAEAQASAEAED